MTHMRFQGDAAAGPPQPVTSPVTRRTVARGLAWSVPTIAMVAAAPAMATSGPEPKFTFLGACKSPGNSCAVFPKGYDFRFEVCNDSGIDIWLYSVSYTVSGTNLTLIRSKPTLPVLVKKGKCVTMIFRADSSNSSNQNFTAIMTIPWGHEPVAGTDPRNHPPLQIPFAVNGTPPDCACTATPV